MRFTWVPFRKRNMLKDAVSINLANFTILSTQVGAISFLVTSSIAMFLHPNYIFFSQFFSELGLGPASLLFTSSLVGTGLLLSPFYAITGLLLLRLQDNTYVRITVILGPLSSILLILTGLFNMGDFFIIHNIFAISFFVFSVVIIICMYKGFQQMYGADDQRGITISPIFCGFMVGLLALYAIFENYQPLIQKILVYFLLGHILHYSFKMQKFLSSLNSTSFVNQF
ncbi:MAG: DUF998 domain-containing protein [Candidatus Kariarchaeaceae archaeon]|jgi:hypothetical protein